MAIGKRTNVLGRLNNVMLQVIWIILTLVCKLSTVAMAVVKLKNPRQRSKKVLNTYSDISVIKR